MVDRQGQLRALLVADTAAPHHVELAERKAYTALIKRATEQAYTLPMHTFVTRYAYAKDLNFKHPCCCYALYVNNLSEDNIAAIDSKLRAHKVFRYMVTNLSKETAAS